MKELKILFTLCLALTIYSASAQLCTQDKRFTNAEYFSNTQIDSLKNVTYGNAIDYLGEEQELKMGLYFPNNDIDTMGKRPFILLIHGGGFSGGQRESMNYQCMEFAKRGFVTATMSYRVGFDQDIPGDNINAVYRAQQDASAALRYVVANSDSLKIDSSWIFIGGSSAGAITSLFTSYSSQSEWNQVLPQLESELGSLALSGNNLDQIFTIKGVYNHSGAIPSFLVKQEELLPTISFHGELDKVVPIDKHPLLGIGSRPIHKMLNDADVCNDFTIVPEGYHNIYDSKEGQDFKINRAASFFKSLFCDTCTSSVYTDEVVTIKKNISLEVLGAIKDGNIQKLDALIGKENLDKCHNINGGLYNYLAFSIKLESLESLKFFVNKKANVEGQCTGKTPLMYAAKYGQLDSVKFLLLNGAKLNATNNGKSALDYAVNYNHSEIKKYLEESKSD